MKRNLSIIMLMLFAMFFLYIYFYYYSHNTDYITYFSYDQNELQPIERLDSEKEISTDELQKWDSIAFNLVKENKLGDAPASRIYAYLYVAQHDAAYISYNLKHKFVGSIDPISIKVLCVFFKNQCDEIKSQGLDDNYSSAITNLVMSKINHRIVTDNSKTKNYPEKTGIEYWKGRRPYFGQEVGSWTPWIMKSSNQFRAPVPPSPNDAEWNHQLAMTRQALSNITDPQKKLVVFWAGNPGTVTPPGQWLINANDYMWAHDVPLAKILLVRAVLAMGIADSVIAVFDSKYSYWRKRPNMLDASMQTIMPVPNHPSYPAGHAAISSAAAVILTYYFPDSTEWKKDEFEASSSRIWGGIHFPLDSKAGNQLGEQVGKLSLKRLK